MVKPVHRDDIPPELLEQIEGQFPEMKVICVGDMPAGVEMPEEVKKALAEIEEKHSKSIQPGLCIDCGAKMENYPETPEGMDDAWKPAKGWSWFESGDDIVAWQCPDCNKKEEMGCETTCS